MTSGIGGTSPTSSQQRITEEVQAPATHTEDSGAPTAISGPEPSGVGVPQTGQSVHSRTEGEGGVKWKASVDTPAMQERRVLIDRSKDLVSRSRTSFPASVTSPQDANRLMGAAANAKELADRVQTDRRTGEKVPLTMLTAEERKTVMDLRRLHSDCMAKLSLVVKEEQTPNVRSEDAVPTRPQSHVRLADLPRMSLADKVSANTFRNEFKALVPKELADKLVFNLRGGKAKNAANTIVYLFDQSLKGNSRLRIAMGLYPEQAEAGLDRMIGGLKLSSGVKADLKRRLAEVKTRHLCSPAEIQTAKDQVSPLGAGAAGIVNAAIVKGREVVIKTAKSGVELDMYNEMLIQDDIVQNMHLPKVVGVVRAATDSGDLHLVMEKVRGSDCGDLFVPDPRNPPKAGSVEQRYADLHPDDQAKAVVHILSGLVGALEPMHAMGIGHWDLKVNNFIFNFDTLETSLIDFGQSGRAGSSSMLSDDNPLQPNRLYPHGEIPRGQHPQLTAEVFALGEVLALNMIPRNSTLKERLEAAVTVLQKQPPEQRPTMHHLKMIFDGRPIPLAERPDILATDYEILKAAFSPAGPLAGGREVMSDLVRSAGADG